jgi:hypothetical protein
MFAVGLHHRPDARQQTAIAKLKGRVDPLVYQILGSRRKTKSRPFAVIRNTRRERHD